MERTRCAGAGRPRLRRVRLACSRVALASSMLASAVPAGAHGNLSMEADYCKLRVGKYVVHFTGYLPEGPAATKEFCEDIPATGRALIVLDYVDADLRDMPASFRIVDADAPEAKPVVDVPARTYPNGTISVEHEFDKAGRFVGILTVRGAAEHVARFPFAVGSGGGRWKVVLGVALALAALAGAYVFGQRQRGTSWPAR